MSGGRCAPPADAAARFVLSPHVFLCVDGGHVVLLDLKRDEYFALDAAAARGLAAVVPGWPAGVDCAGDSNLAGVARGLRTSEIAQQLVARGLLSKQLDAGKRADCTEYQPAETEITADFGVTPPVRARDVFAVLRASLIAFVLLRSLPLERVVRRAHLRRLAHARALHVADIDALRVQVLVFERLRPLFFSSRNACLLASLALIEFLARRHLYPAWIFGVRTRPFAAHCWIQHDAVVCNDTVERVCRFKPIMAI